MTVGEGWECSIPSTWRIPPSSFGSGGGGGPNPVVTFPEEEVASTEPSEDFSFPSCFLVLGSTIGIAREGRGGRGGETQEGKGRVGRKEGGGTDRGGGGGVILKTESGVRLVLPFWWSEIG